VSRVFTDTSRTVPGTHTVTGLPGPRVLPTLILYPAEGTGPGPVPDAAPAGHGFPLVVFAPGFDRGPASYRPLLRSWARAGYVVAAVTFPLTNPGAIGGLDEYDIVHQPGDVRFVITQLVRAARTGHGVLRHLVDPAEIAVAGHSDGAQTAIMVGAAGCCRDARVDAILPMAGANLPAGSYFASPIPTLVMQGTADPISPEPVALHVYTIARPPKYLLLLHGADHLQPFAGTSAWERVVSEVSTAFLDRYLRGSSSRIRVPASWRRLASLRHVGR
jgi:poly(3-hydroxybutyrate) depolymerase